MAEERVTIEPEFRSRSDPKTDRGRNLSWIGAGAMVIAALIFGALVSLPMPADNGTGTAVSPAAAAPQEDDHGRPATAETPVTTLAQVEPLGRLGVPLREMVPGFTDTIMMLTTPPDSFNVIRWRAPMGETEVMLSLDRHQSGAGDGWPLGLDASGYRFAEVLSEHTVRVHSVPGGSFAWQPGDDGEGLLAVVWHDTEPSRLGRVECLDPQDRETAAPVAAELVAANFSVDHPDPPMALSLEGDCQRMWLERWGAWGTLLMSDESLLLVDTAGTVVPIEPESQMLSAGPDGATLWTTSNPDGQSEALVVRSAGGETRVMIPDLRDDVSPSEASWSPDGVHIALSFGRGWEDPNDAGLRIMDAATGAVVAEFAEAGAEVITTAWSSDGRFLVYESWRDESGTGALVFHDTATNRTTLIPISEIVDEIRVHDPAALVVPAFNATTPARLDSRDVSPSSDRTAAPPVSDDASHDTVGIRLPVGARTASPDNPRLDFLNTVCDEYCFRDAVVIDPNNERERHGTWLAREPFHVRHGFINEGEEPLGEDFIVDLSVTRRQGLATIDIDYALNHTYRFSPDYVLRGTTPACGPGYRDQTENRTCEWFVHEFPDGLPPGRYDIWAEWFAPCSAWQELGLIDACPNPGEVTSQFASSVNMPFYGDGYWEGEPDDIVGD